MDNHIKNTYAGVNRNVTNDELYQNRSNALARLAAGGTIRVTDEEVDTEWARFHKHSKAPRSYYDYYFGGTDIKVYVAELGDDSEFGDLPIADFAFGIEQQKVPLYGFWDYTHSAVMRGTRLVQGQFTIVPPYPGYVRSLLAAAASQRVENNDKLNDPYPRFRQLTEDDKNIDSYWTKHLDPSAIAQGMNEYSVHPPFNLIIVFGVQGTSVETGYENYAAGLNTYEADSALHQDHNQRLVEGFDSNRPTRYMLEGCEILSMNTGYSGREVVAESYSFFARDLVLIPPGYEEPPRAADPIGFYPDAAIRDEIANNPNVSIDDFPPVSNDGTFR